MSERIANSGLCWITPPTMNEFNSVKDDIVGLKNAVKELQSLLSKQQDTIKIYENIKNELIEHRSFFLEQKRNIDKTISKQQDTIKNLTKKLDQKDAAIDYLEFKVESLNDVAMQQYDPCQSLADYD